MNCPNCKQPNGVDRNYCGACGTALTQYCRACGFRNSTADGFCGGCGLGLSDPVRARLHPPASVSPDASAASESNPDLAELLEAAREEVPQQEEDASARVTQNDIDELFGD